MKVKEGDVLEWDTDFDNSGPLGPYLDYPIVVDKVHDNGLVDITIDPSVLPMHLDNVLLSDLHLRPRRGKEDFDNAIAKRGIGAKVTEARSRAKK